MRFTGSDRAELRSRLAAEYVLGTLRGAARRRFESIARDEQSVRNEVEAWSLRLTPLAERVPAETPPTRVWRKIQSRIETPVSTGALAANMPKDPVNTSLLHSLLNSLGFWRSLGMGAATVAAALVFAVLNGTLPSQQDPLLTAVLEDQGVARMVVEQPSAHLLTVKMVKPWMAAPDNSLQLWVLGADGKPRSLGIIQQDGTTKIDTRELDAIVANGALFALSKEPRGGSPTGLPTGTILCKGVIAKLPAKLPAKPIQRGPV